ncbi:MAG: hypothetical protein R2731_03165 [Nocardioides sp.]
MSAPVRLTPSRRRGDRAARPAGSPVLRVGVVLIAVQLLLRGWALSGSWFFFDDLAFMSAGMNDPLDQHFVTRVYAGHVMPGGWLVVKWLATAAPYQWPAWAAVLLGLQAVAGLGMLRLLRSMFGESQLVLALLAGYLFYVFTLPAGLWFAAGINQLPLQVALVFGLHAHLAYLRTRRWQHVAATLAWTAFGLAFYEKAALLFLIYAIVALGWFARGTLAARAGELWSGPARAFSRTAAGRALCRALPQVRHHLRGGGQHRLAGGLGGLPVGGPRLQHRHDRGPLDWRTDSTNALASPGDLVSLASWVALGALVWYAAKTRTLSRRAWWLIGSTTAANVYLVSSARANLVGADIGLEYRYQTEAAAIFVLGRAGAAPAAGCRRGQPAAGGCRPRLRPRRRGARGHRGRGRAGPGVEPDLRAQLADQQPHRALLRPGPGRTAQRRAPARSPGRRLAPPDPAVGLRLPREHLQPRLPRPGPAHRLPRLVRRRALHLRRRRTPPTRGHPGRALDGPGVGCGYVLERHQPTVIPLDGPVIGGGWWIRMGYASPRDFEVTVRLGSTAHTMRLPRGFHTVYYRADGEYDSVEVDNAEAGATACINELVLGLPGPAPAPA